MSAQSEQVLSQVSLWLRHMSEKIRGGHPNNAPYAVPYDKAADALTLGIPEPAIELVESHRQNANSQENEAKYSTWLTYLASAYESL